MELLQNSIESFLQDYFNFNVPSIHIPDILEILIIAFFIYEMLVWVQNTRAWVLMRGIMVILGLFLVAAIFQMHTILWLGDKLFSAGFVAVIVVFQPELRKALEQLGRNNIFSGLFSFTSSKNNETRFSDKTITDMVMASFEMGAVRTGALIVIEKEEALTEYERTGITLDSLLSRQLLINIFEKNTPLHDGAVIVRGDRIVSATCYLPLSDNMQLSKDLGTRHRAAVGVSEACDALTIVVSEETGMVSVAQDGKLMRNVTEEQLTEELRKLQKRDETKPSHEVKQSRFFRGRRSAHVEQDKESDD